MRACGRCDYANADHLNYCCSCGRRMAGRLDTPRSVTSAIGVGLGGRQAPTGLAPTVALSTVLGERPTGQEASQDSSVLVRGFDALRYVFVYMRGRIDAEDRKRTLADERDGAKRLVDAALAELGRIVLHHAPGTPELATRIHDVARANARRQSAIADLAVTQKFQVVEDLRLAAEQTAAEAEWNACDLGAGQFDKDLQKIDAERREVNAEIGRLRDDSEMTDADRPNVQHPVLAEKRAHLDEQYGQLRERAAALRASTIAARAKLDQTIAARRQATAAIAAGLLAHTRERSDAEKQIGDLTLQLGRVATEIRVPLPAALPGYARVDRLEETIADCDRQISGIERTIGRFDIPKLATGLGLLTAIASAVGVSLWALLR